MKPNGHPHSDDVVALTQRIGQIADGERTVDVAIACGKVMAFAILSMKPEKREEAVQLMFKLVKQLVDEDL